MTSGMAFGEAQRIIVMRIRRLHSKPLNEVKDELAELEMLIDRIEVAAIREIKRQLGEHEGGNE